MTVMTPKLMSYPFSVALKLEPTNLNVLWDRAALCYQMGDHKKALEFYESALKVIIWVICSFNWWINSINVLKPIVNLLLIINYKLVIIKNAYI